jgi:hypothetical protein
VNAEQTIVGAVAAGFGAVLLVPPNAGSAHDLDKVKAAMTLLKSKVEKPGPAKIERTDTVAGKTVPAVISPPRNRTTSSMWSMRSRGKPAAPPRSSSKAG